MNTRSAVFVLSATLLFLLPAVSAFGQGGEIAITTSSDEARKLFVEGRNKFENVELAAAADLFDQAIQKEPNFAMAYFYRSQSGGGFEAFRKNIDKAVGLADKVSPGERLMILGVKANFDGNDVQFKKNADELLKMFPNDKRARMLMANYYGGEGDTESAAEWYRKSIEADPNFAPAYNFLGYSYKILGDYKNAEETFKKYTELAPNSANPADSYAELLLKMGRFDEAIEWYQKALSKDPGFTGAHGGVGFGYIHKGNFTKARESFEEQYKRSTQINGKLGALSNIVYSYLHEWDIPGALKATERFRALAEKENPLGVITSYVVSSYINLESGNTAEAQKQLDLARKSNETTSLTPAAKSANEVNLGLLQCYILMRGKDLAGARKQAGECTKMVEGRKITAEHRNLNLMLGNLECELGNHDKALEHLDNSPNDNPYVMFSRAVAYERKGDHAKALDAWRRARKAGVRFGPLSDWIDSKERIYGEAP